MAREKLTVKQQLESCRTRLYLERSKSSRLKKRLEKEQDFVDELIRENIELKKELIKANYENDMK